MTQGQIGSDPRVVKEADALHEAGFRVTVIATRTLDCVEPRDQSLMRRIPWRLERIDLRSLLRWRVMRSLQLASRQAHSATGLARLADLGLSPFTPMLMRAALRTPADLYIAHYPSALPAAAAAARRHDGRYAYDAEDFHLGDWPDEASYAAERSLVRDIESRYLPRCAHVTAASPGIADALVDAYGIARPQVVLNTFPLDQAPVGSTPRGTAKPGPSLYWFSQTIGPNRGLECAVRAIGLASSRPHLYLRGSLAAGFGAFLQRLADEAGAGGRVHILPPAEPAKMERLAAAYDLGLASETGQSVNRQICLTNKLFSFLLAGVPPLMSSTSAQRAFGAEAGVSDLIYSIDDAPALARLVDQFLADPILLAEARAKVWRLGQERFNWERECGNLISEVERTTPEPRVDS